MKTFKITKHLKVRYCIEGVRFEFKYKGKYISIKINNKELKFLELLIKTMRN